MEEKYDSTADTLKHIENVQDKIGQVIAMLCDRSKKHDASKLESPEKETFDEYTPKLKDSTYGSSEYQSYLDNMSVALNHHYDNNRHHPEHFRLQCPKCKKQFPENKCQCLQFHNGSSYFEKFLCPDCTTEEMSFSPEDEMINDKYSKDHGINGMNLIDLIEMICDWKAASERHADGDIFKSIEINSKRFNITPQLKQILLNTAKSLFNVKQ